MLREHASTAVTTVLILIVLALVAGQMLGQPILLSFVTTGSMAPTLDPGDGFVAVPQPVAGDVSEGDVVTFDAEELHDGGLVTHRVVGETEAGYVTKGDANPFTDQDGPEPHVTDDQIVATALRVDGEVVVVPRLGTVVVAAQDAGVVVQETLFGSDGSDRGGVGGFLVAAGAVLLIASLVLEQVGTPQRERSRSRRREGVFDARLIVIVLLILVLVPANAAMLGPAGAHDLGMLSTEDPEQDPYAVAPNETTTVEVPIHNDGVLPVLVFLSGGDDRVVANDRLAISGGSQETGTFSVAAPAETRPFDAVLVEHRYLLVLPPSLLAGLHAIHPWLAHLAVNLTIASAALLGVRSTLGFDRVRMRSKNAPFSIRLRRFVDSYR